MERRGPRRPVRPSVNRLERPTDALCHAAARGPKDRTLTTPAARTVKSMRRGARYEPTPKATFRRRSAGEPHTNATPLRWPERLPPTSPVATSVRRRLPEGSAPLGEPARVTTRRLLTCTPWDRPPPMRELGRSAPASDTPSNHGSRRPSRPSLSEAIRRCASASCRSSTSAIHETPEHTLRLSEPGSRTPLGSRLAGRVIPRRTTRTEPHQTRGHDARRSAAVTTVKATARSTGGPRLDANSNTLCRGAGSALGWIDRGRRSAVREPPKNRGPARPGPPRFRAPSRPKSRVPREARPGGSLRRAPRER